MCVVRGYEFKDGRQYESVQHKTNENDVAGLQRSIISGNDAQPAAGYVHGL